MFLAYSGLIITPCFCFDEGPCQSVTCGRVDRCNEGDDWLASLSDDNNSEY